MIGKNTEAITVLIADDEPLMCRGLTKLLQNSNAGFNILGYCQDGSQAFQRILHERVDILITDIRMPVMDGLKLAREIRKQKIPVRIIILSGFPQFEYAQEALGYGVISYLLKPIDNEKLLSILFKLKDEILTERRLGNYPLSGTEILIQLTDKELLENEEAVHYKKAIQKMIEYIDNNTSLNISIKDIAADIGLNSNYLSHLFKQETGQSFIEYITELRIKKAQKLLCNTNLKTYAIARMIGYSDSQYFSQVFKRFTGITPGQYRESFAE